MNYIAALLIFGMAFAGMAMGLIFSKKVLRRGCSIDPDECKCLKEGKDPNECDKK